MKHQNGLRIYGIYNFDKYPEWDVLITDLQEDEIGDEWLEGLAFNHDGTFSTGVSLTLPMQYKEVGYLLGHGYKLHLDKLV